MKNTSGVSLAAGGSTPNERFQIANIISFEQIASSMRQASSTQLVTCHVRDNVLIASGFSKPHRGDGV